MDMTPILQRVAEGESYGPYAFAGAVALGLFCAFLYFVWRMVNLHVPPERDDDQSS